MRVLVTGATGFVGRWLVAELGANGHEIAGGTSRIEITSPDAVDALVRDARPDGVVHLAAVSYGPDATRDPDAAMLVNARGTRWTGSIGGRQSWRSARRTSTARPTPQTSR